ncbi:hypothetical protein NFI96_022220 [Prochilodus magdalenae]|nr:hypothetical protein NFI96_022220 [Prochilodus magdalenae]
MWLHPEPCPVQSHLLLVLVESLSESLFSTFCFYTSTNTPAAPQREREMKKEREQDQRKGERDGDDEKRERVAEEKVFVATSDGTKQGIDSMRGGVCVTRGMKVVLKVGQTAYGLPPKPKPDPARTNPRTPGQSDDSSSSKDADADEAGGQDNEGTVPASNIALIAGGAGGAAFLLLIAVVIGVVCYRRRKAKHSETHHPALTLSSMTPKRGSSTGVTAGGPSMGGNTCGSEPSDIIIPLRTSDSAYCPHYEKVSGDYGHPVYIVQEMPPQSPANIYYKV